MEGILHRIREFFNGELFGRRHDLKFSTRTELTGGSPEPRRSRASDKTLSVP